ncbi:MAG: MopE-related protein [Pseudomonadota bacterium]
MAEARRRLTDVQERYGRTPRCRVPPGTSCLARETPWTPNPRLLGLVLSIFLAQGCMSRSDSGSGSGSSSDSSSNREAEPAARQTASAISSGSYAFAAGSLIVPMDLDYQDAGMLRAYGLVYRLLQRRIPVYWVISKGKAHNEPDFSTTESAPGLAATVYPSGTAVPQHAYRGGPFVIDEPDSAAAKAVIDTWRVDFPAPVVAVHESSAPFTGHVKLRLVAAPTVAMVADGFQKVARAYMKAAGIPDSTGDLAWADASADMLDEAELAGATIGPDIAEVGAPTVSVVGTAGSTTWSYVVVAIDAFGRTAGVNVGTTTSGNALLDGTNYNRLSWSAVQYATGYEVYRVAAGGGTPATTGLAGSTAKGTLTFNDTGKAANGVAPPVANTTGANHRDGALFDGDGNPAYCQIMSMHWTDWKAAEEPVLQEIVEEYRAFLQFPVHLFAECQAVNAIENHGHFLTDKGFYIGGKPNAWDHYNSDLPFAQMDGVFPKSVGGSEPTYSICDPDNPTTVCSRYLDVDIVMITEAGTPTGVNDVWMTGYYGGECSILSEYCDPVLAQGKVSYLGGHEYDGCDLTLPVSECAAAQGVRLFLNALFEAPCATDLGQPSLALYKDGPRTTTTDVARYTFVYSNAGPGMATNITLTDPLGAGISYVAASPQPDTTAGNTVVWSLGNLSAGASGIVTLDVRFEAGYQEYGNSATLDFRSGTTPGSIVSNAVSTCFHAAGDLSPCTGGGADPSTRACADGMDDDGDGLVDYPADPGCHAQNDDDENDPLALPPAVRPRVLIVFDTSGSMNWNTCSRDFSGGDGSLDCPGNDVLAADCGCLTCGNGKPDDSRLHKVKSGVTNLVTSFGEVEYGLMRFHQIPVPFGCPARNANQRSGGWLGAGISPCSGFAGGDLLVSFDAENAVSLLEWIDGSSNYPGNPGNPGTPPPGLDIELRGTGNTPLAGALEDALTYLNDPASGIKIGDPKASCRPYRVILVTDGEETCGGDPVAAAQALKDAGIHVSVIGFAADDPNNTLNAIARAGSPSGAGAIFVDDATALAAAAASIVSETILVELCNGVDDDCDCPGDTNGDSIWCGPGDVNVDEDFSNLGMPCDNHKLGICRETGIVVCDYPPANPDGAGQGTLCTAASGIEPGSTPEVCNRLDDDCDGEVDEPPAAPCNCLGFEMCNGLDDDCDGSIDESPIAGIGGSCGLDTGACERGTIQCVDPDGDSATPDSELRCAGGRGPEMVDPCDGEDNDCDGLIDEGPGDSCYPATMQGCAGDAISGFTCASPCRAGRIECADGVPGECAGYVGPTSEACNGIDDDCDGVPDQHWKPDVQGHLLGSTCSNGLLGECGALGIWSCDHAADPADVTAALICTAPPIAAGIEVCNGLDDDCDGVPDDDLGAPIGSRCGHGCSAGTVQCVDADGNPATPDSEIRCVSTAGVFDETCNGADDDCDGFVDEDIAGVGVACYPVGLAGCSGDATKGYSCDGRCKAGLTACEPPEIACNGFVGPAAAEACNGEDDDCDGSADEEAICPADDEVCFDGECVFPCDDGEFPCPFGRICRQLDDASCDSPPCRFCVSDPCLEVMCEAGYDCDSTTGECRDLCAGVECRPNETCRNGLCLDCLTLGCADGEVCVAGKEGLWTCEPDPCYQKTCDEHEFCRDGECVDLSCDPPCLVGEICFEGNCRKDKCARTQCPEGSTCDPANGDCVPDLCAGVACPSGTVCDQRTGECRSDPCHLVSCPEGFECHLTFEGTATCLEQGGRRRELVVAAGGGGCGCAVVGRHSARAESFQPLALLVLLLPLLTLLYCRLPAAGYRLPDEPPHSYRSLATVVGTTGRVEDFESRASEQLLGTGIGIGHGESQLQHWRLLGGKGSQVDRVVEQATPDAVMLVLGRNGNGKKIRHD